MASLFDPIEKQTQVIDLFSAIEPTEEDEGSLIPSLETAATFASGIVAEPVAGLVGIAQSLNPFAEPGAGARAVESTREALTFRGGKGSQEQLEAIGETLAPVGEALSAVEEFTGDVGFALGGATGGAIGKALPTAIVELIGFKGLSKIKNKRLAKAELTPETVELENVVRQARSASEESGIGLFKAQQTLNPTDIERQSFIATLPAGSKRATEALSKQNTEAFDAVNEFMNELAPPESITNAAENFRGAAQQALEREKLIRKAKTSPLYKNATRSGQPTDLQPVRDFINSELSNLPEGGEISRSLKKVTSLIASKKGRKTGEFKDPSGLGLRIDPEITTPQPTLKQLHNAKLEIDQMLNKFGSDSLGNTTKGKLSEVKDLLLTQMEKTNPLYREARQAFEAASPPVNKLNDSIIGAISGMNDTQLKNISKRIFDPAETNPAILRLAKKAIEEVDPDAWNVLLRSELERRMGSIRSELGDLATLTAIENVPAQLFNSVFGNKKSRNVLFNAVDGDLKKNLAYLQTGLKRAAAGRPGGSQTAIRGEIKRELSQGIGQSVRDFFRAPLATAAGVGEDVAFTRKVKALSDVMFDPQWKDEMKKIRKFKPASKTAQERFSTLLNSALILSPTIQLEGQE